MKLFSVKYKSQQLCRQKFLGQETKSTNFYKRKKKLDFTKIKIFCPSKDAIKKVNNLQTRKYQSMVLLLEENRNALLDFF